MTENPRTDLVAPTHVHTTRCWWDHTKPGWICPSARAETKTSAAVAEVDRAVVDVRDMFVVHTAVLREFRLLRGAVADVAANDRRQAQIVDSHLGLLCDLLHHHHVGEDELLWPLLAARIAERDQPLLDVAEAQHAGLDQALAGVARARQAWVASVAVDDRAVLVTALLGLSQLLTEHLEGEERNLLPLAAVHLTEEEWAAIGEHGAASTPKPALLLVFGMFAYEGDPEVLARMLSAAPAIPRMLVPRIAPRVYARRALKVYGTRTP